MIFFVRQKLTSELRKNLHMAPPGCRESESGIKSPGDGWILFTDLKIPTIQRGVGSSAWALCNFGPTFVVEQRYREVLCIGSD